MIDKCSIWGSHAPCKTDVSGYDEITSVEAGGTYRLGIKDDTTYAALKKLDIKEKRAITNWLVSQWMLGIEKPILSISLVQGQLKGSALSVAERCDRLLCFLRQETESIGTSVTLGNAPPESKVFAWTASATKPELRFCLEFLNENGFVTVVKGTSWAIVDGGVMTVSTPPPPKVTLTIKGYGYLESLDRKRPLVAQAFVAMWFDACMEQAYFQGIMLAIGDAGYASMRIDGEAFNGKIDDRIIAEIRRSAFVVVDLTHGTEGMRGGVYYEAGFAHGLNLPVIFTCRQGTKLHFDVQQYNCIFWDDYSVLREKLCNRICATIGDGPKRAA